MSVYRNVDRFSFLTAILDKLKNKTKQSKNLMRVQQYSRVVEGVPRKVSLERMPMVWTLVFPSVEECQVQKPCIRVELQFISSTQCLYSEV